MVSKSVPDSDVAVYCPHLGISGDPATHFGFASIDNVCHYTDPPSEVNPAYQRVVCLSSDNPECPVLRKNLKDLPLALRRKINPTPDKRKEIFLFIALPILILIAILALVFLFFQGTFSPSALISDNTAVETSAVSPLTPLPTPIQTLTSVVISMTSTPQSVSSSTATTEPTLGPPLGGEPEYVVHRIKTGESFWVLAQLYETTQGVIIQLNDLSPGVALSPDQLIVIKPGKIDAGYLVPLAAISLGEDIQISDLAVMYAISESEIRQYNDIGLGDTLFADRWLIIPKFALANVPTNTPVRTLDLSLALSDYPFGPHDQYVLHLVLPGQSMPLLERLYLTSADVIRAANNLAGPLQPDQVLVIVLGQTDPAAVLPLQVIEIEQDILASDLAAQLGVFLADLRQLNDLEYGELILAGRWLIYPSLSE